MPVFDFTQASGRAGWAAAHDISSLTGGADGLTAQISGADPYMTGPAQDYPAGQTLWARLRLRSDAGGSCQLFYYVTTPTEAASVRFAVPQGRWVEGRVPLPPLGTNYRMRIDPPGTTGKVVLERLSFEARGTLPDFDFATLPDAGEWSAPHDISSLEQGLDGLRVNISGGDPYLFGPSRDYPTDTLLWLNVRLWSEQSGVCQVFYFSDGPTEEKSVRISVPGGGWYHTRVPVPALGPGYRLRIDPPGSGGSCLLGRVWFEERVLLPPPVWPVPKPPEMAADACLVRAGELTLRHDRSGLGAFVLEVADQRVAMGNTSAQVGYVTNNQARWFPVQTADTKPTVSCSESNLVLTTVTRDPDGADWTFQQEFRASRDGVIETEITVSVNRDRQVLYLPGPMLLAGVGSWGTNKNQGLFAGIEYLDDEPSSSEKDLEGEESWRLVPDAVKSTFPLMAVQREGRYVGLIWEQRPEVAAVFDSPDRQFQSGGHLLGILFPGSNGGNRPQNSLLPYDAVLLRAGVAEVFRAELIGGEGETVIPAVRAYVALRGLPPRPDPGMTAQAYYGLAARGWLDSRIRETNLFRHAYWPGFSAGPAADAALWMDWLARRTEDADLAGRLTNAAIAALGQVSPGNYNSAQIGHIRYPAPALRFGYVLENAAQAEAQGQALRQRFQPDGTVRYVPRSGGLDYGRTHWTNHASGLTAAETLSLLEAAAFSGDAGLVQTALKQTRLLDQYRAGVPRGAQTWEIPLHTPDILASAYLLRAYTLAYELSGDAHFLEEARYWAWTGVPFVYLRSPVNGPVGPYATIPVLGATAWVAPVWIGLPVQWCGLVYADALYRFAGYDPDGPWLAIADGIAASGVQQTWPVTDTERLGLLPDVFQLKTQTRDGPAINPATVQIPAMRFFGELPSYTFRSLLRHGLRVHAPGAISEVVEQADSVSFLVQSWTGGPYRILVNGLREAPKIKLGGRDVPLGSPHQWQGSEGRLMLLLQGDSEVTLIYPATQAMRMQPLEPGRALLSWPLAASNSVVEMNASLTDSEAWREAKLLPVPVQGQWVTTLTTDWPRMFYRLKLAEP